MQSVTLNELDLLVQLARTRSIRELARRQSQPPGQVSKALKRLERKLQTRLVERNVRGVVLTSDGLRALPVCEQILAQAAELREDAQAQEGKTLLGIGATSFLINHHLTRALTKTKFSKDLRFRFLEIPPDQFTTAGLRHAFELAFHFGRHEWPGTWFQDKIAEVGWSLCCSASHAFAKKRAVSSSEVLKHKFIMPAYWTQEGFALGDDGCPVPANKRLKGHETSTAEAAMALVRSTDQLAFLPNLLIRTHEERGEVRRLEVKGWLAPSRPLFMTVRSDLLSRKLYQEIRDTVTAQL